MNKIIAGENKIPSEMYPKVAECERRLNNLISETIDIGGEMLSAANRKIYLPDMLFAGAINRSINLLDAILCLTGHWNFIAAGSLIRLHMDTLLCLSYLHSTENPDLFIQKVLGGTQLRKIRNKEGKTLTDTILRDYARPLFPQIDKVYTETSRLVHFSNKLVFTTVGPDEWVIGKGCQHWTENDIRSLLECAIAITDVILAITRGWILKKTQIGSQP